MKKKQVVALLLTAAMTTASFLPSTGFFNITEVQASPTSVVDGLYTDISLGNGENVSAKINVEPSNKIASGDIVTLSAIVSGASVTSVDALATSLGAYELNLKKDQEDEQYTSFSAIEKTNTGAGAVTKSGLEWGGSSSTVTGAVITRGARLKGYGRVVASFVSAGVTSFGAEKITLYAKVDDVKEVKKESVQFTTEAATAMVNEDGLELTMKDGGNTKKDYVSDGGFAYQWFVNESDNPVDFTSSSAFESSSGWKKVEEGGNAPEVRMTKNAHYAVSISYGEQNAGYVSEGALFVGKTISNVKDAVVITSQGIKQNDNDNNLWEINASYERDSYNSSNLKYQWYAINDKKLFELLNEGDNDQVLNAWLSQTPAAITTLGGVSKSLNTFTYKDELAAAEGRVVVVVSEIESHGAKARVFKHDGVLYEDPAPNKGEDVKAIAPGSLEKKTNVVYVSGANYYLNSAGGNSGRDSSYLRYSWYVVDSATYNGIKSGSITESSLKAVILDKKSSKGSTGFITSGQSLDKLNLSTVYSDEMNAQYKAYLQSSEANTKTYEEWEKTDDAKAYKKAWEKAWTDLCVAVIVSDSEGKVSSLTLATNGVSYVPSAEDKSTGRRTTPSNSGSTTNGSNTNGTTGSNSSSGGGGAASNGTNTTGTTTKPAGTTSNVVTNADGSKTTTTSETKADGTKVETTKTEYPDGSTLEVTKETKPDGTTIETTVETAANGDKATTVYTVSPNGTKSKKVSIVKADGTSETTTITENKDGSATIVNETKDASGTTSMAYSLAAGASGVTVDKIDTTAKKVVIPAKIAIAGGAATLKGVTSLKANTLTLEGKTIKVTKVGAAALKGNKTATNLVVGKNIKTIGKQAFMNASKVKTVKINGNVNTVGKNSFKNINKKATIKIKTTAKQFKALKKKIKNKGAAPAKVTYKRVK